MFQTGKKCGLPWLSNEGVSFPQKEDFTMTDQERSQIRTYQLDGLTPKQISELTGISQNTIKVHCHRYPVSKAEIADHKGMCRHCGRPLMQTPHKKAKRYCSDKCRMAWWKDNETKLNKKAFYRIVCQHCGTVFESYGKAERKYCSRGCYALARKKVNSDG